MNAEASQDKISCVCASVVPRLSAMFIIWCNNNYGLFGIQGHNINQVGGTTAQRLTHTYTHTVCVFFVCLFLHAFTHSAKTAEIMTPADNPTI